MPLANPNKKIDPSNAADDKADKVFKNISKDFSSLKSTTSVAPGTLKRLMIDETASKSGLIKRSTLRLALSKISWL